MAPSQKVDQRDKVTLLFCVSSEDGTVAPARALSEGATFSGAFEVGRDVADRYRLREELGSGAMGRVFLAHDLRLDRPVAIKVVTHHKHPNFDLEQTLEREAKLGASLNHKGIAAVLDFGIHENKSFTVFEFVEGETLRMLIERRSQIPLHETQSIIGDLAVALDFAHSKGIIHRDLKPENICLSPSGEFKVLDFGLAERLASDQPTPNYSGTPAYSSPEQAACRHTDGRSDQYSLAVIAFEMLSGTRPFVGDDPIALLREHMHEPPPELATIIPDLPATSASALRRALSKVPDERFPTCQEFAYSLGPGRSHRTSRHTVRTAVRERIGFYVCHGGEESLFARRIVQTLEHRHYRCWFYGRDTIPGISSLTQSKEAIERSQAVILLISRAVIRSHELQSEIAHAQSIGCPLLTVLVDLSREEFEQLNPPWRTMLGLNPVIEQKRLHGVDEIVDRFESAAAMLDIRPDESRIARDESRKPTVAGQRWATDANQIDIHDLDRVIYQNDIISDFLDHPQKCFLAGTKGLGKTLLLTRKRQLLMEKARGGERSVTFIPEGRPYLDFMSEMRSLSANYQQPLSELSTTKRLWSTAIRLAVISHHSAVIAEGELEEFADFPPRIRRWLCGGRIEPTVVFKELTTLRVSQLNRLIDHSENYLDQALRRIHGGTCLFVDKVDQAIRHLSCEAWIAIQAGLVEAAWEIMNANSHIKIYATIRQEAFSSYQSDIKSNLFGAISSLEYTSEQLCDLLDRLSDCYEGKRTFADFIGARVIRHPRRLIPEDSFQYVRRHTLGRPRDLVAIASELSRSSASLSESRLRQLVERTSGTVIVSNIFNEVQGFLDCLADEDLRRRMLSLIPCNILDRAQAIQICESFNGLLPGTLEHFGEDSADLHHPFRDLYVAGLLGYVDEDPETQDQFQRFRQGHDSVNGVSVPDSNFYLIHPGLNNAVAEARGREPYLRVQQIAVGDMLPWHPLYEVVVQIERLSLSISDSQFRDHLHVTVAEILTIANSGNTRFVRSRIDSSPSWQFLQSKSDQDPYVEILLWVDELIEAI